LILNQIKSAKKIVLLEPPYPRKYIPLGLAKIATFAKRNGSEVVFQRQYQPVDEDLVCITSLFTYDSDKVLSAIKDVKTANEGVLYNREVPIIVGGVYASLMPNHILKQFPDITIIRGCSEELDQCVPDYSIDWQVEDAKWNKFSYVFTSRGCPNRCAYCAVWRLEANTVIVPNWKEHIIKDRPYVMISDNNLSAQPIEHIEEICNFISENKKSVVFDNGFDCKHINEKMANLLSKLKFVRVGLRLAFDRIEEDGVFQEAIRKLKEAGVPKGSLMAYVLFNFKDTPKDAIYRAEECVRLGIRPYPQKYTPLNKTSRSEKYVGEHWTPNLIKAYRYFFLMASYYTKYKFVDWVQTDIAKNQKVVLTEDEIKRCYAI
jgi:hypothetical protein